MLIHGLALSGLAARGRPCKGDHRYGPDAGVLRKKIWKNCLRKSRKSLKYKLKRKSEKTGMNAVNENTMKDISKELKKLGDAVATSLGFMVIAIGLYLLVVIVMREIYFHPPEESDEMLSSSCSRGPGIAVQLSTNPTYNWHPSNIYHR